MARQSIQRTLVALALSTCVSVCLSSVSLTLLVSRFGVEFDSISSAVLAVVGCAKSERYDSGSYNVTHSR